MGGMKGQRNRGDPLVCPGVSLSTLQPYSSLSSDEYHTIIPSAGYRVPSTYGFRQYFNGIKDPTLIPSNLRYVMLPKNVGSVLSIRGFTAQSVTAAKISVAFSFGSVDLWPTAGGRIHIYSSYGYGYRPHLRCDINK